MSHRLSYEQPIYRWNRYDLVTVYIRFIMEWKTKKDGIAVRSFGAVHTYTHTCLVMKKQFSTSMNFDRIKILRGMFCLLFDVIRLTVILYVRASYETCGKLDPAFFKVWKYFCFALPESPTYQCRLWHRFCVQWSSVQKRVNKIFLWKAKVLPLVYTSLTRLTDFSFYTNNKNKLFHIPTPYKSLSSICYAHSRQQWRKLLC